MKDIEICYTSFDKILKYLKAYSHNEMKNYNLTPNEIQVLSNLDTKCTSSEIAKQVNASKALVSRSVKLLLQKGYITATLSEIDKREFVIKLTESGEEVRNKIMSVKDTFTKRAFQDFGEEEFTVLKALLGLVLRNLGLN